jgi:zinc protease
VAYPSAVPVMPSRTTLCSDKRRSAMPRSFRIVSLLALALLASAMPAVAGGLAVETYTLPNGLTVILHPEHQLPQVTVNVWYNVGSQDERKGRTGFAHLFEHLMYMGTTRVPGNQFDMLMENQGGSNNANTSEDRTDYFSVGPSSILPTLLWLDADRMEALGKAMTQEKLDLQRSVVRNERRQSIENRPYASAYLVIPDALYPESHPYHHSVIGSHEDLEAATLADVKDFFATYYVPGNATLVVSGDFDPAQARKLIADTFGAVPGRPIPTRALATPVGLEQEVRRIIADKVEYPRIYLVWHSPAAYRAGDAEMTITASILADGESGRLYKRLVQDERLAQDVTVSQSSSELGSQLIVDATAVEGADLEQIKRVVLEELERYCAGGPTAAELSRVKAIVESRFMQGKESLLARATLLTTYRHYYGVADAFERDLQRQLAPTQASVGEWARKVFGPGRLDLRVLPLDAKASGASLDTRPSNLPVKTATVAAPQSLTLESGARLEVLPRPGSGLFTGFVLVDGGNRILPATRPASARWSARC